MEGKGNKNVGKPTKKEIDQKIKGQTDEARAKLITSQERKEAIEKLIGGTIFQIVQKETNLKTTKAKHLSLKGLYSKEENAKARLLENNIKNEISQLYDNLIVLKESENEK